MSAPEPDHCSVPYWRKSKLNAARCVPVLMRLEAGRLTAHDRDGAVVFDVPAATARGRLTRMGTLVLGVDGRTFELVGRGVSMSPSPSAAQEQGFEQFWAARPPRPIPPGEGAGFLEGLFNGGAAWHMRTWQKVLRDAGASID